MKIGVPIINEPIIKAVDNVTNPKVLKLSSLKSLLFAVYTAVDAVFPVR